MSWFRTALNNTLLEECKNMLKLVFNSPLANRNSEKKLMLSLTEVNFRVVSANDPVSPI